MKRKVLALVAPHVGAWIEILGTYFTKGEAIVAPHVGAWIEILSGKAAWSLTASLLT